MENWNRNKRIFKDIDNLGYPFYHVHPYKQNAVKFLVDRIDEEIKQVLVFGSAVHTWHFYEKDLDLCFICPDDYVIDRNKLRYKNTELNILTYPSFVDLYKYIDDINCVRTNIVREGVLVYARKD